MEAALSYILFPLLDSAAAVYAVLFGVLVVSGAGVPIPEEVTLAVGGYLAHLGVTEFWTTVYVLGIGIIAADVVGYLEGRFAGGWIYTRIIRRSRAGTLMVDRVNHHFRTHGVKTVMASRVLVGIRVAVPIFAGHARMNFLTFLFFDALAAIPWTIALVSLSYYLGSSIDFLAELRDIRHIALALFALTAVVYAGFRCVRLLKKKELTLEAFFAAPRRSGREDGA